MADALVLSSWAMSATSRTKRTLDRFGGQNLITFTANSYPVALTITSPVRHSMVVWRSIFNTFRQPLPTPMLMHSRDLPLLFWRQKYNIRLDVYPSWAVVRLSSGYFRSLAEWEIKLLVFPELNVGAEFGRLWQPFRFVPFAQLLSKPLPSTLYVQMVDSL